MRTLKQRTASWHNWQLYRLEGIKNNIRGILNTTYTLTDESKYLLKDLEDQISLVQTSMKIRKRI